MNNYYPWIYEFSRRKNLLTLGFIYIFSLVISYISLVSPESTFVRTWLNDVLALVNSAHRVFQGQFPSIDFHTLYGPLVFYFPALGFHAGLPPSTVLAFGGVLAAAILLLAATLTMYSRFSLPAAVTTLVFLWLLIVVPMGSGKGYSEITWGAYYNRHAWAAVAIIFLFYVEPKNEHLWDKWIDSFILSVLAVFAFYTKITYGLVAVGFVLANIISSKYNRKISIISIVFFIFFALLSEILLNFHLAYLENILVFVNVNPGLRSGVWRLLLILLGHIVIFWACGWALMAALAVSRKKLLDGLFVLCCVVASLLLLDKNGGTMIGLPALIAVFVCCGEIARRGEAELVVNVQSPGWRNHPGSLRCLVLAVLFVTQPVVFRTIAWHEHYTQTTNGTLKPLPGLPKAFSGFLVPVDILQDNLGHDEIAHKKLAQIRKENELSAHEYMLTIVEGFKLLETVAYKNKTLFVLDNADPFSIALDLKPTEKGFPILWAENIISKKSHPPGEEMFFGVDYVMIPIVPYNPVTERIMTYFYGDYLNKNFVKITHSPHWRLLGRKP